MIEFELDQRYDKSRFMAFLKTFLPDDYVQQEKEISINFKANFITKARSLGTCKSIGLEVLEVQHSSLNDARVGLSKDGFRLLLDQSYHNRALVVFLPEEGGQWRLSLIQMEAEMSEHSARIQRSYSNPRRYSFLLGEGAHVKTPHQFLFEKGPVRERRENNKDLSKWDDLLSRFSVEALTKEFYDKLYHWYQWAVEESTGVYFPNKPETVTDDREAISANIIRLITRLLFVWFIKQKGLVPNNIFDTNELDRILVDFNPQANDSSVYYNAILQNLFFATLNNEIDKRGFVKPDFQGRSHSRGVKTLYRDDKKSSWFKISPDEFIALFHRVPYMNCGLFECLDKYEKTDIGQEQDLLLDGFSSKGAIDKKTGHFKYRAFIPNHLFFAPEHRETVTVLDDNTIRQETITVQGLITLFEEYNFTVEENTPVDVQVSLDPELLGRVFENLLAAYNPETGASARNSTGSFYTPREIVEYMVNESLIEYLKAHVPEGEALESQFRKLVSYLDNETELTDEQKDACLKALYDCKILDPACGSGAFPMGMLQQMVHIIKQLDPDNEKWRQVVLDKAIDESKKALMTASREERQKKLSDLEEEFDDDMTNSDYKRKLYLIQNCIYGVDIQPIAMLISKLRFFISLVCEQDKIDFEHPENNYGINTLPNLETKFVSANTLLSPDINNFTGDWTVDEHLKQLKDDLIDIRMRHFKVKTQRSKQDNRDKDEAKREEILDYIINSASKPDDELIANRKALIKQYFDELVQYREKKIEEVETKTNLFGETTIVTIDVNAAKRRELQDRIKSCEEEIRREENKKNPAGFEAAVKQVTEWNPYDQNASAPFFSPEWMFGVNEGFDVVIGNPPYIQLQADGGKLANLYAPCGFETFNRGGDIYCLFYERGNQLLKDNGSLCYITSNKWMRAGYGAEFRNYLTTKTNPKLLIDFGETHVFESATVMTNILLFHNAENSNSIVSTQIKDDFKDPSTLTEYVSDHHMICQFEGDESWVIMTDLIRNLKKKVEAKGKPLGDWDIEINYGIKTGFNKAFIISEEVREGILDNCQDEDERQRTDRLIRPILRGKDVDKFGYRWANIWLICTFPSRGYSIDDYPAIKDFLLTFTVQRLEQTGKTHIINGEKVKSRKRSSGDWYETQDSIAYWEQFLKPKIVYPNMTKYMPFYYDEQQFFTNQKCFIITGSDMSYLTAFLNSSLFKFCFFDNFPVLFGGARELSKIFFDKIPVLEVDDATDAEFRKLVLDIQQDYTDEKAKAIDQRIFDLYGLTQEERDAIGYIDFHNNNDNEPDEDE